jgi:hypothetical protein
MKKVSMILTMMLFLFSTASLKGQSKTGIDYFAGKWAVLVTGTPNGDGKMVVTLEKKEAELSGAVLLDSAANVTAEITKVELAENSVMLYFNANGYDVYLSLKKKDDDNVTGSLLEMFEAEGVRIKL